MMKYFFLILLMVLSTSDVFGAKKKRAPKGNPSKEAGRVFEKALKAQKAGDLNEAKRLFTRVEKNYPKVTLNDEHESDVESYGPEGVTNYGDYANFILKFLNRELKEGEARTFKTAEAAMEDLLKELKAEDKIEIEKSLWVEVELKKCENNSLQKPPEEVADLLMTKIKGKGKSLKATENAGSDPSLLLEISSNDFVQIGLARKGDGWVWNQVIECQKKNYFN
jgi:hypothetical protein